MERHRAWRGPALLSFPLRPFFLLGASWAALAMIIWTGVLAGQFTLPTAFDPVSWHAHEFLFGYTSAILAGYILTTVPNWTGSLPVAGWPLAGMVCLWLAGRLAVAFSHFLSPLAAACIDLALISTLVVVVGREIVIGRNWHNLPILLLLGIFGLANALFHREAAAGDFAAQGFGLRSGLAMVLMMIAWVGGQIIPSFTRNWLAKRGAGRMSVAPMQTFDRIVLVLLLLALAFWVVSPFGKPTGVVLAAAGFAHLVRLARWAGDRTIGEPLVLVLHLGYLFVPLGALASAGHILGGSEIGAGAAQHLWMAGAIGLMTLAVMTRAALRHLRLGQTAVRGTGVIFLAVILAVIARIAAGLWPDMAHQLHIASAASWIAAFAGFAVLYGPLLIYRRKEAG